LANLVIGYRDRVAAATVDASSELPSLPAVNLSHPFLSPQAWRSTGNSAWIRADLGTSQTIGVLGLFGTSLTEAATVRVRLSANADLSSPTYDTGASPIAAGVDPNFGALIHLLPTPAAGRYLRLDLADASLTSLQAGRLWAGTKFQPVRNMAYGYKTSWLDSTRIDRSESAQSFVELGTVQRELRVTLPAVSEAERQGDVLALARLGRGQDVLLILDPASSNLGRDSLFGLIAENLSHQHTGPNRHALDLVIVERK
jgi:hypothetical protein